MIVDVGDGLGLPWVHVRETLIALDHGPRGASVYTENLRAVWVLLLESAFQKHRPVPAL